MGKGCFIADMAQRQINEELLQKQSLIMQDLCACAKDNDSLRGSLLSLAGESSTKEQTLSTALIQLKSLSESFFHVKEELKNEKNARQDEVSSLQWSLDDMSRHTLKMSEKIHKLESQNDSLRNELKQLRLERWKSVSMCRAARGY